MKRLLILLILLSLTGSGVAERLLQPFTADYQLLLDGKLVGHAYFKLEFGEDDHYQFEVLTVPAGQSKSDIRAEDVYEASSGHIVKGIPVPERYYFSTGKGQRTQIFQCMFDWKSAKLTLTNGHQTQAVSLTTNTQDRLSYLLLSMQLTQPQEPAQVNFSLIELEKHGRIQLIRGEQAKLNLPHGEFVATEIRRKDGAEESYRHLWFTVESPHLPVLFEYKGKQGLLRMELLKIN